MAIASPACDPGQIGPRLRDVVWPNHSLDCGNGTPPSSQREPASRRRSCRCRSISSSAAREVCEVLRRCKRRRLAVALRTAVIHARLTLRTRCRSPSRTRTLQTGAGAVGIEPPHFQTAPSRVEIGNAALATGFGFRPRQHELRSRRPRNRPALSRPPSFPPSATIAG